MSLNIKFPEEHYLGLIVSRQGDDLPLAFLTPEGSDQQAAKRKGTVDNWVTSNSWAYDHTTQTRTARVIPSRTVKNEPLAGFRLLNSVKHGGRWGAGNIKWRLEDPRGFELEITSSNLMEIMACTTIEDAEIQDMCMWAREGSDNILVPVSSDVYKQAMTNTARAKKSASLTNLKVGDTVILQNGTSGIYYGKLNTIKNSYTTNHNREGLVIDKPRFILVNKDEKKIYASASIKMAEIIEGDTIEPTEAERTINELMKAPGWRLICGQSYGIEGFTHNKKIDAIRKIETVDWVNPPEDYSNIVFSMNDKYWQATIYRNSYRSHVHDITYYEIHAEPWLTSYLARRVPEPSKNNYYSSHPSFKAYGDKLSVLQVNPAHIVYMEIVTDLGVVIKVYQ